MIEYNSHELHTHKIKLDFEIILFINQFHFSKIMNELLTRFDSDKDTKKQCKYLFVNKTTLYEIWLKINTFLHFYYC